MITVAEQTRRRSHLEGAIECIDIMIDGSKPFVININQFGRCIYINFVNVAHSVILTKQQINEVMSYDFCR